jgi:lysophospholipase L1-like esterase
MRRFAAVALFLVGCGEDPTTIGGPADPSSSTTPSTGEQPSKSAENPADTTPRVRYVGRVDRSDSAGPRIAWPGTRVIIRFRGSELKAKVHEEAIDGSSRYDVFIDDKLVATPFAPNDGDGEYTIASKLAAGEHVVELRRRTEAMVGVTQFLDYAFPNGELLAPPAWPNRRIEFLGDSESTGYGVECDDESETFTAETENADKAFPSLAAAKLKAEVHNVSFAGKGIIRNEESENSVFFGDIYPRALPSSEAEWDFSSWQPDVVWITLGANDWGPGLSGDLGPPDADLFENRYADLVALVRAKNPNAQIVCSVQGMVNDDWPTGFSALTHLKTILNDVVSQRRAKGDSKVFYHELPRARSSLDLTGCSSHPNAAFHQKASASVAKKIAEITHWD